MKCWNVCATFLNPNGTFRNSNNPNGAVMAVLGMFDSLEVGDRVTIRNSHTVKSFVVTTVSPTLKLGPCGGVMTTDCSKAV